MPDDRRMTTDRFFGGVSNRLDNLYALLAFVRDEHPPRETVVQWLIENTNATSEDAVNHHLAFLDSIELIDFTGNGCRLGEYGENWLTDQRPETLYAALTSGVKGFNTILRSLVEGPMTDEELVDVLVSEFEEANMTKPGPAIRHREWLQVLGYVERHEGLNRITPAGREMVAAETRMKSGRDALPTGVSPGDRLVQDEIEEAFDTGFGYRISGINPRRDENDQRYILVFATKDGPYDDSVRRGRFEYVGEGLSGDQSETSSGNSSLIDAIANEIPVHFFYQESGEGSWEYQGEVDAVDYRAEQRKGRRVLVFTLEHAQEGDRTGTDPSPTTVETERIDLQRKLQDEPPRLETEAQYVQTKRRARDAAFADLVTEAYSDACAICGTARETPGGRPEVEAAHIYPKREGGVDDVRNGLAHCRLHHWAFDSGLLAINDEYEVLVYEAPHRDGYEEFTELAGSQIQLPDDADAAPVRKYLEMHRELHDF